MREERNRNMKRIAVFFGIAFLILQSVPVFCAPVLRFGTLPVIQALPLFVASEKGFFKEQGLEVELATFNSAMEKDVAFTSGQIAGYFGDTMTPMVLEANKVPIKMVATIFNTTGGRRMFAILAPPRTPHKTLAEAAGAGIAVSSNTIVEYIMFKVLESRGILPAHINTIEVKNIPIRLQMLQSGQVGGAILPEPLVTLAEANGARVLADDSGRGISATVLAFSDRFLKESPGSVKAFLAAVSRAGSYIHGNPSDVRPIMNRSCQVPEPLHQKFAVPAFPKLSLPEQSHIMDVYGWLRAKGIIKAEMTFGQMVADGYLP
jgi:NitT/TauT family transport system substrate-binding protein